MKSPCTRKLSAFFLMSALFIALAALAAQTLSAAQGLPVAVVDEDDLITLLSLNLEGRDVAVAAWSNMSPFEKQQLRDQAVHIATMAHAAERDGLASSPEMERVLRWETYFFLAKAWEKKISSETDLSEDAVRSFYEANRLRYMDSENKPLSFEQCTSRVRDDIIRLAVMERIEKLKSE